MFQLLPVTTLNTYRLQILIGTKLLKLYQRKNKNVASQGKIKQLTCAGYTPRRTVVNWILEAWKETTPEIIKKSFKAPTLILTMDGSEEIPIYCFEKYQSCRAGK